MHKNCQKVLSVFLFFFTLFYSVVLADDVEILFDRAYNLLNKGNYTESYLLFSQLRQSYPDHHDAAAHLFFKGKAAFYAGEFSSGIADLTDLISNHPGSSFIPYGYFFIGNAFYRMVDADRAFEAYANAYASSVDNDLDEIILASIETGATHASVSVLSDVGTMPFPEGKRCALLVTVSRALMKRGNFQLIGSMLSSCRSAKAAELTRRAAQNLRQKAEIGIALPLSGDLQKYGEQLLDGVMLRVYQFKSATGRKMTPVIYDTKGNDLEAARVMERLSEEGVSASIGPLTSDAGALASAVLSCSDMPLIIPAASQGGLTELSRNTFQLQPNLDWQGLRMADFAIKQLKADTAAIITPTASENLRMAKAFKERFEELGGTILGVEYFRAKETDFGPFVRDLKSLIIGDLLDSIIFIDEDGDTIDAEEVPVYLDCIYIPASAGQLRQLLPQINFYNLNTIYLGGDGWGADMVYRQGPSITKNCYFSSGLIGNNSSDKALQFATEFDLKYGRQPGRLEALGYDAMDLICRAFLAGNYSRIEIGRHLKNTAGYNGVSGKVTFGKHRENIELPIYTIENHGPVRVSLE